MEIGRLCADERPSEQAESQRGMRRASWSSYTGRQQERERERTELPAQACTQPMQLQFSQAWQADPANHDTVEESVLQDRILGGKKLEMKGSWALEYHTLILFSLKEPV